MKSRHVLTSLACATAILAQNAPLPAISMSVQGVATAADPRIKDVMVGGFQPPSQPGGQPVPIRAFTPETVFAAPGDTIRFTFMGGNNSVMQATPDQPCQPLANGFTTGPQPNMANDLANAPRAEFRVPDQPGPLYMSTLSNDACGAGMVMTINPPVEGQPGSHSQFKLRAITSGNPGLMQGGGLVAAAAVPQVASTISIQATGVGTPAVQPLGPPGTLVQGTGRTGNGQACGCQCLCGGAVAAAAGVGSFGQGSFGGVIGQVPALQAQPVGAMSPAPMRRMARLMRKNYKMPLL